MKRESLRGSHDNLLALHALPLDEGSAEDGDGGGGDADVEGLGQRGVVRREYAGDELLVDLVLELGGADAEDEGGVEIRDNGLEVSYESVGEHVLSDGDEEGAAEGLREHHDGSADRNVLLGEGSLHSDKHLLHAETDTGTEDELVTDPLRRVGVCLEGGQQTGTDGHQDGGQQHEGSVVADSSDESTRQHGNDDETEDGRQVHDTGLCGADTLDGLEPDGDVVDHDEESGTQHGTEPGGSPHVAVLEHARRNGGILLLPDLHSEETDNKETSDDQERDDAATLPLVLDATPLQGKEKADDGGEEQGSTLEIKLLDLFLPGSVDLGGLALDGEEGDDEGGRYGTEGQVDVEAPSPSQVIGKGTTKAKHC